MGIPVALLWFLVFPACCAYSYLEADAPVVQDVKLGAPLTVRRSFGTFIDASPGVKHAALLSCLRVQVPGVSRLQNLHRYPVSFRLKVEIPAHGAAQKVEACFHSNASLELCQCAKESWRPLEKGLWSAIMSPFETRFLDIRILDSITDISFTISIEEEFWPFRLVFLGIGLLLLLVAPLVSDWVPFYYSSGMTLGIFLIVLVLLFQGMKLLPTGRKSTLYIVLYGSVVGMGTMVFHYFTGLVSSLLKEIGISDESYNPVAIFLMVGVVLMGAWLGYWGVRKFVLSEDGTVDIGTAQFVKWALRVVGGVMIMQSSHDPLMAVSALLLGIFLTWAIRKAHLQDLVYLAHAILMFWPRFLAFREWDFFWKLLKPFYYTRSSKIRFLSNDAKILGSPTGSLFRAGVLPSLGTSHDSPFGGALMGDGDSGEYLSTFHKIPKKKHLSQSEWANITQHYTKNAMQELTSSPKFASWFTSNVDRVLILPTEKREDRSIEEIQATAQDCEGGEASANKRHFFKFGF